jgi:spore germination cell wall hydrolase CwlJ-like protein
VLRGVRDIPSVFYRIADDVLNGRVLLDEIDGARYYMTKRLYYSDKRPSWANKLKVVAEIGNHVFLTE